MQKAVNATAKIMGGMIVLGLGEKGGEDGGITGMV